MKDNTPFRPHGSIRSHGSIRVLIVDDHAIVREGLRALIDGKPDLTLAGEAANGAEAVEQAAALQPDVILMDLVMPRMNGIEAIRAIRAQDPNARILVLTSFADDAQVFDAIRGGALGYLLKDSSPQELVEAIRCVHRGEPSLHPSVARKLVLGCQTPGESPTMPGAAPASAPGKPAATGSRSTASGSSSAAIPPEEILSEREIEVLRLLARGLSNQDIARQIYVSEGTVRFHVSNILAKLQLDNRTQAVLYALRTRLVTLE